MTPERWNEVERIYQAALDSDPAARSVFLDDACKNDPELRREVVALLEANKPDDRFLESTALEVAARAVAGDAPRMAPGQRLGSYELIAPLGAGGMGEVWRALDTTLNRQVAIKILPSHYSRDPGRLRRFAQEARTTGMLNHPNVLAIYAIGEHGGSPYLVTELLEGANLRQRLAGGSIPEGKAVEYGWQVTQGLAAAHEKGIVHRDLKPENIFITRDGRVKILDFGLAKLTQAMPEQQDQIQTDSGIALGTPAYMSPEQVRGQLADHRSDIFALGVVLYEMLSGRRPFIGDTSVETMNAILKQDPPPISQVSPVVEEIVRHCLEKDREERVQSARDLGFQLRLARHSSAQNPVQSTGTRSRFIAVALAGLAIVGATAGLTWWLTRQHAPNAAPTLTRLTSDSGLTTDPALSPDGKLLAFASDRSGEGNLDIWLQQVGRAEAIRLTTDPADDQEPSFSPDGTKIVFRSERDGGGIYVIPILGGTETKIAALGRTPRFSPDGNWIAYWVGRVVADFSRAGGARTYVVAATGGTPRQIQPEFASARHPVWSADGKHILFLGGKELSKLPVITWDWWVAPLERGTAVSTGASSLLRRHKLGQSIPRVWTSDGQVIFAANLGDSTNIWRLRISPNQWRVTETLERLTSGAGIEDRPAAAAGRMVFSTLSVNINIWSLPLIADRGKVAGELQQLTHNSALDVQPDLSADGQRLVFMSKRSGNEDVWGKDLITGKETALTISPRNESRPAISADGSRVAYPDWTSEKRTLHIASLRGRSGDAVPDVCDDCFLAWDWSPDNKYLLYWSMDLQQIGLVDIASRQKSIVLKHPQYTLLWARFSPDGRWIAFHASVGPDRSQIFIAPFHGMSPIGEEAWIALPGSDDHIPRWSPDGNSLYLLSGRDGYLCLWRQRLHPNTKRPLGEAIEGYHLHGARRAITGVPLHYLEISVARDKLVFPMSERTGNIWMAEWRR
jgi:eukaryotic-like serine/threonine-protein kinase